MLLKTKRKELPVVKTAAGQALELLPQALAKSSPGEQKLLRHVLAHANPGSIRRLGALLVGGGVAVSLAGNWLYNRVYRAAVAKELKKQLAPVNKKLDELEKQNEELRKQNEQLKKQLR